MSTISFQLPNITTNLKDEIEEMKMELVVRKYSESGNGTKDNQNNFPRSSSKVNITNTTQGPLK